MSQRIPHRGRGAQSGALSDRFNLPAREADGDWLDMFEDVDGPRGKLRTTVTQEHPRTILSFNKSPDIAFDRSINAYRGCEHGCAYCYARPTHETLGMNAGLDFESRILVKHDAPKLLRQELNHPRWEVDSITISGNTDCYQPAERKFRLTRQLVEILLEARHPFEIITKNALVLRDLDLLQPLAEWNLVRVNISITTLDAALGRTLEPRTSSPEARLRAIRELTAAGVSVRVMFAPVIPGLNDHEMGQVLAAARDAGARGAGYVLLRLPHAVAPIFLEWLRVHRPLARDKVEALVRDMRDGALYQSKWRERQRGAGPYAASIAAMFKVFQKKYHLDERLPPLDRTQFRPPRSASGQGTLF